MIKKIQKAENVKKFIYKLRMLSRIFNESSLSDYHIDILDDASYTKTG
jgi:hypothetical protein